MSKTRRADREKEIPHSGRSPLHFAAEIMLLASQRICIQSAGSARKETERGNFVCFADFSARLEEARRVGRGLGQDRGEIEVEFPLLNAPNA